MEKNELKIRLLVFLMSISAGLSAASTTYAEIDDFFYILADSTATLTHKQGEYNCYWGNISIPRYVTYEGKTYRVARVGDATFKNCSALASITIPETIESIGSNVFEGCTALTSMDIPGSVTSMGKKIFMGCSNLRRVTFCDGSKSLNIQTEEWSNSMFNDCPITTLYLGRNINYGGDESFITSPQTGHRGLFTSNSLESVAFGDNVTSICYLAFAGCEKLSISSFPHNIRKIGVGAFAECKNIISLVIENSEVEIEDCAFWYCTSLTDININIPIIGCAAFDWCMGLQELTLGKMVSKIGGAAFRNCTNLKKVYCFAKNPPTTDQSIWDDGSGNSVFEYQHTNSWGGLTWSSYAPNVDLYVPETSVNAYKSVDPWKKFKKIEGVHIPVDSILLNSQELTMNINTTVNLSATVFPDDASDKGVIWDSSNDMVVTVDNGKLFANGEGYALIYATSVDNPDIKASCVVHVVIPVNGISLSTNAQTLNIGDSIQLEVVVTPVNATNKNIIWNSSNESVCTVNDGMVTAKKAGVSIITATSEDGGFTAICTFTVTQQVTGITLNYNSVELHNIGETFQLVATVLPEDASNKEVRWTSSNQSVCMVANGTIVAVGYGTSVIIATTVDGSYMATCTVNVVEGADLPGDVNHDGEVNIADINAIIDIVLGGDANDELFGRADVNDDGEVNIADINTVIDIILSH